VPLGGGNAEDSRWVIEAEGPIRTMATSKADKENNDFFSFSILSSFMQFSLGCLCLCAAEQVHCLTRIPLSVYIIPLLLPVNPRFHSNTVSKLGKQKSKQTKAFRRSR